MAFFRFVDFGSIEDVALGLRWTPTDLASEVSKRAQALHAMGIKDGSIVAIVHSGTARFFADLFAAWTLGCTAACIDPTLTEHELSVLVEFIKPSAILRDEIMPTISASVPIVQLADLASNSVLEREPPGDFDRLALVLFTSGTTGKPKAVVLTFQALLNRIANNKVAMGHASRERTLLTLSTSFGHGLIGNALTPLLSGGDLIIHPLGLQLARNLGGILDEYRIGFLSSVPSLWRMVLKFSNAPSKNTLARIHVGSAPLSPSLWQEIVEWSCAEVVNCYGITELANWVAGASSRVDGIADGLIGRPWGGAIAIEDAYGTIQDAGEGELLVKSPAAMAGYLHRPDLTAAAFTPDGWYRTGDTGHIDTRGLVRLTGRIKDEINRAGLKVQPSEIDALLESHPAISEACVFGISDAIAGEIVAVAVLPASNIDLNIEALRQWCAERLRREAIPEKWFVVNKLPRNERGKISRRSVRQMLVGE
jgi:acyl-CoA synthetase (AMP-forming)/AMP-acid ligase II